MTLTPAARDITTTRRGHVLEILIDRAHKRNAFTLETLAQFAEAYDELENDPDLRVGLVHAAGDHFTAGLDLADVAPAVVESGQGLPHAGGVDPFAMSGPACSKPVVVAIQGLCYTLGVELVLAADITVASDDARFVQFEIARGIMPFGGGTFRWPARVGWGDAMRWLLTAEPLPAAEAHRIGLVQELTPPGAQLEAARAIADRIATMAPLGVQGTLANARLAARDGEAAATAHALRRATELFATDDAAEGVASFVERRDARFTGH